MAIRSTRKSATSTMSGLANVNSDSKSLKRAALLTVDTKGNIQVDSRAIFMLNPSAVEDSKSANWVQHQIPGQSDPVMQWISSGPRTVTFEALVTADTSNFSSERDKTITDKSNPKNLTEYLGEIASQFFGVSLPAPRNTQALTNTVVLDISSTLDYYRSLLYPEYVNDGKTSARLQASPPLLVLMMGSSIAKLPYEKRITNKHDVWVLTDLRIRVTKQLQNLSPMEATVQFTLVQYNIRSFSGSRFRRS